MGQGSGVAKSCGIGCRRGSDPKLLWLWHRPAATAPIRPLAWEPPYAAGAAPEKAKRPKKSLMEALTAVSKNRKLRKQQQGPLIFHKRANTVPWEGTAFSTSGARTTEESHAKE